MAYFLTFYLDQDPHDRALGSFHGMRGETVISLEALVYKQHDQSYSQSQNDHHISESRPSNTVCF